VGETKSPEHQLHFTKQSQSYHTILETS